MAAARRRTQDDSRAAAAGGEAEPGRALARARAQLSPAQRRVAEVVLRAPEVVAFGTVAEVAARAGASGPTVVRLADRLGYRGFVGLQAAVRRELRERLRPALERVRSPGPAGSRLLARVREVELANVRLTLEGLDPGALERAAARLADPGARVAVLASEQARGVGALLAGELAVVRDGVELLEGAPFRVATELARLRRRDCVVLLDLRRHERWLLDAAAQAAARGAARVVLVDSELSPLADGALAVLPIAAQGAGPFDSHVGMLAAANALVAGVASRLRPGLARRLEALERVWRETGVLVEE